MRALSLSGCPRCAPRRCRVLHNRRALLPARSSAAALPTRCCSAPSEWRGSSSCLSLLTCLAAYAKPEMQRQMRTRVRETAKQMGVEKSARSDALPSLGIAAQTKKNYAHPSRSRRGESRPTVVVNGPHTRAAYYAKRLL